MKRWDKLLMFWGILDVLSLLVYGLTNIINRKIPFLNDMQAIIDNSNSFGLTAIKLLIPVFVISYVSLAFSGYFLIKQKKIGVIISYIQFPLRLITIIPPSISVLMWFLGPIKNDINHLFYITFSMIILTEIFKIFTLYK
jgi:hypothetical protein